MTFQGNLGPFLASGSSLALRGIRVPGGFSLIGLKDT